MLVANLPLDLAALWLVNVTPFTVATGEMPLAYSSQHTLIACV